MLAKMPHRQKCLLLLRKELKARLPRVKPP